MNKFVIDASVAVKCFFWEEGSEECLDLLSCIETFFVPDFFLVETDSAITKKIRRREIAFEEAMFKRQQVRKMPYNLISYDMIEDFTFELASKNFISLYDASYLAVAIDQKASVYTADKRFYNSLSSSPFKDYIEKIDY